MCMGILIGKKSLGDTLTLLCKLLTAQKYLNIINKNILIKFIVVVNITNVILRDKNVSIYSEEH